MPAAVFASSILVSTYMPLARHDGIENAYRRELDVSTHMPLARHDLPGTPSVSGGDGFYSHASCEA